LGRRELCNDGRAIGPGGRHQAVPDNLIGGTVSANLLKTHDLAPPDKGGAFSSGGRRLGLVAQGLIPSTDRQHAEQISGFILRKRSPNEICRDLHMKTGLDGKKRGAAAGGERSPD
jgi:hypothetical protein